MYFNIASQRISSTGNVFSSAAEHAELSLKVEFNDRMTTRHDRCMLLRVAPNLWCTHCVVGGKRLTRVEAACSGRW
jgi:hypothetical protein